MTRRGLEGQQAQPETFKFLNLIGWAYKPQVEMRCKKCYTVNYPAHVGMFDYIAIIRSDYGPLPIGVEIKATRTDRWSFSEWGAEQRAYAAAWRDRTNPVMDNTFMWLQFQDGRVDAKDVSTRRRVWFVPQLIVLKAEKQILETGVKSLPMARASLTKGRDNIERQLHAEALFEGYELTWFGNKTGWWPKRESAIWDMLRMIPNSPQMAHDFNALHLSPDMAVRNLNMENS